jgi:head-tail adaptor
MQTDTFKRMVKEYGKEIIIQERDLTPAVFGSVDSGLKFTEKYKPLAIVSTKRGSTLFDGVNQDHRITHKFCIEYLPDITAENWVLFKERRFDIVDVENCCEDDKLLILRCNETGKDTKEVTKA